MTFSQYDNHLRVYHGFIVSQYTVFSQLLLLLSVIMILKGIVSLVEQTLYHHFTKYFLSYKDVTLI